MQPINYKNYLIEDCEGLAYLPAKYCYKLQITNLNDCDAPMMYCETIEEAKEMIDEDILEIEERWLKLSQL